ncbi:hypothetical protein GCM10009797_39650 [Nocardioides hwasunensis]
MTRSGWLSARETVWAETPASALTSAMVTLRVEDLGRPRRARGTASPTLPHPSLPVAHSVATRATPPPAGEDGRRSGGCVTAHVSANVPLVTKWTEIAEQWEMSR